MIFTKRKSAEMNKLIGISSYDEEFKAFKTKNGFLNIYMVSPNDLKNMTSHDKLRLNMDFVKYYKTEQNDLKIVSLNYPTDTALQIEYLEYKKKQTANTVYQNRLIEKIDLLKKISSIRAEREYYIFVFTKNIYDFKESEQRYRGLIQESLICNISCEKKKQIVYKYNNMNKFLKRFLSQDEKIEFESLLNVKSNNTKKIDYNFELISDIQPQGGISFNDEKYVKTGDGYCTCMTVTEFPSFVSAHWLGTIVNIDNCITTVDITNTDNSAIKKNINKSIKEQASRLETMGDYSDKETAQNTLDRLKAVYAEISSFGEAIKKVIIRIYVSAKTLKELEERTKNIQDALDGKDYDSTVYLNSSFDDWSAFYKSYEEQHKNKIDVKGTPIQTETLARGNPFHFTKLSDPNGSYLGQTATGGSYLFDYFKIDNFRTYYNSLILGLMGKGKSTLAKWILEDALVRGNKIRAFDPNKEFYGLAEKYGAVTLTLGSSSSAINQLQILKADERESTSFAIHISKLKTIFKIMSNTDDSELLIDFQLYMEQFYNSIGLSPEIMIDENGNEFEKNLTGLKTNEYPIWSDFIRFLEDLLEKIKNDKIITIGDKVKSYNAIRIEIVKKSIQSIVNANRDILDCHTAIEDINSKQFVVFDTKNIRQIGGNLFRIQLFLALSFCWQDAITSGYDMKKKYEEKKISFNDITRTLIVLEECSDIVNTDNIDIVAQLNGYNKEGRKYYVGFMYITQNIREFASDDDNEKKPEGFAQITRLFELTQNKFIFEQPESSKPLLRKSLGSEVSDSLIDRIPRLVKGECIARLSTNSAMELNVYIPDKHLDVYKGGS